MIPESNSMSVDCKKGILSNPSDKMDEETSDRLCMQMSYSRAISKSEHSTTLATQNSHQHTATQSKPAGMVTVSGKSASSMAIDSTDGTGSADDASGVIVPFGWRRMVEDGAVCFA
jgi:hypothetical protein